MRVRPRAAAAGRSERLPSPRLLRIGSRCGRRCPPALDRPVHTHALRGVRTMCTGSRWRPIGAWRRGNSGTYTCKSGTAAKYSASLACIGAT